MNFLQNHIEALIFCSSEPVKLEDIRTCLSEMLDTDVPESDVTNSLNELIHKYEREDFAFKIYPIANGYQFLSKPEYQTSISILLKQKSNKRLSKAALESLAIIAYKQPVTKTEVEQIRGVNCDYTFQRLLEKELIILKGKADTVGRPLLYGTSEKFMEYFGINSLEDLPLPRDFARSEEEDEPEKSLKNKDSDDNKEIKINED